MLLGLIGAAMADEPEGDCPALGVLIASAWASFDDAELANADKVLHQGREVLACQPAVVPTESLLEMFRLDGLVALSQANREDAVYATIRAVTIDPDSVPPANYGPELAELTATWVARLARSGQISAVRVEQAWVDGRLLHGSDPLAIVPGEHLVQWTDPDGLHSQVVDVKQTYEVQGSAVIGPPDVGPQPDSHKGRVAFIGGGTALAAGGAGLLVWSSAQESAFRADPFDALQYGDCAFGDSCYAYAREEAIRGEANRIRLGYLASYGLVGLGVVGAGAGLFLVSDSGGIPSGLGYSRRW